MKEPTRIERFVDWAIALINPRRAALRGHFRRFERDERYRNGFLALMNARGYRAAKDSAGKTPWLNSSGSADGEISPDLPSLTNKSRELNRDDPLASGLTATFVANVIGTGLRPQSLARAAAADPATVDSASADHKLQERIEAVWGERKDILDLANNLTHADHQALLYRKVREDGGVLIKRTRRSRREPVWIEVVERDRLATPIGNARPTSAQNARIDDGVEKDADGVPVAYWIMKGHPGDAHVPLRPEDWTRVEASEVQYLRRIERPGQTHGVPAFHAILQDLRDLDLLMLAALKRTQIAACMAVFLKSPLSPEDVVQATGQKYGYKLDQALEPGMIWKLNPEEEIQTLIPNFPTPELGPFIVMLARRIGAALGVSWQVVLKDFSDSTYSSARTDLLEARITYRTDQQWMADRPLRWEWWTVMEDARLLGDPRLAGVADEQIEAVNWIPPGWQWVDPEKEAAAAEIELRLGITTLQDICAGRGKDWEEQMEQRLRERARERDLRAELGIPETDAPPAPAAVAKPADGADDGGNGEAAKRLARLFAQRAIGART